MIFQEIKITNWCQHRSLHIPKLDPTSVSICGDNNVGKTSLLRAMCWMLDTGKSEFGGKEDITDGETHCRVEAAILFGNTTHRFAKWIENAAGAADTSFSIDDNSVTATQYKKFIIDRLGTEDYLSLFIARQEDIHATIREPKTSRNRKLREMLGIDKPEQWGKEVRSIWQEATSTQARAEGGIAEKVQGLKVQETETQKDILGKETERSALDSPETSKASLEVVEEALSYLQEQQREQANIATLKGQVQTAKLRIGVLQEELDKIPGKDISQAQKAERDANANYQLSVTGVALLAAEEKKAKVQGENADTLKSLRDALAKKLSELERLEGELQGAQKRSDAAKSKINFTVEKISEGLVAWKEFFTKHPSISPHSNLDSTGLTQHLQVLHFQEGLKAAEELSKIKALSPKEASELLDELWTNYKELSNPERIDPITGNLFLQDWTEETYQSRKTELATQQAAYKGEGSRKVHAELLAKVAIYEKASKDIPGNLEALTSLQAKETLVNDEKKEGSALQEATRNREELLTTWASSYTNPLTAGEKANCDAKIKLIEEAETAGTAADQALSHMLGMLPDSTKEEISGKAKTNAPGLSLFQGLLTQARSAHAQAVSDEELRKPKAEEKTRLEGEISAKETQIKDLEEKSSTTRVKSFARGKVSVEVSLSDTAIGQTLADLKKTWSDNLEQVQKVDTELKLLQARKENILEQKQKAQEEQEQVFQSGKLLEPMEELQMFLSAKKAPELLLRSAITTILEDTNRMLPQTGLDASLRMDSTGDFEVIYERKGKTVVEPARRQGVGYATLMGMCFKLASTKIMSPQLGAIAFDEPSAAMSPRRRHILGDFLKQLGSSGETRQIIVVEHDPSVAGSCNQTISLTETGETATLVA